MQNNLRVFITNLGKYNEGELVGKWIDIPECDEQEIIEALESIGVKNGTRYGEYFITDYELPFEIEEYTNVFTLNETLCDMSDEALEFLNDPNFDNARMIVSEYSFDEPIDVIHSDEIDDYINSMVSNDGNNWISYKFMTSSIRNINADYFGIDGYGNIKDLDIDDEESYIKDTVKMLLDEYS